MQREPAQEGEGATRTSFFYKGKKRRERVKKKPPSLRSFLLYRKNRRGAHPSHRYLFQSSVFDVEFFCIDKIKQLSIFLSVRGDKHHHQMVRTNSGRLNDVLIPTGWVELELMATLPRTSVG